MWSKKAQMILIKFILHVPAYIPLMPKSFCMASWVIKAINDIYIIKAIVDLSINSLCFNGVSYIN